MTCRALTFVIALSAAAAHADGERFGDRGELVPFGSASFYYQRFSAAAPGLGPTHSSEVDVEPGLLYFAAGQLALGASLDFSYQTGVSPSVMQVHDYEWGLAPTLGYNLWLGERVSFFPLLSLAFDRVGESYPDEQSFSYSSFLFKPSLRAQFLFHLASHFFLGLEPALTLRFYSSRDYASSVTLGAGTILGGWF